MNKLIILNIEEFEKTLKSKSVSVCCPTCNKQFKKRKHDIIKYKNTFCSMKCAGFDREKIEKFCSNCSKGFFTYSEPLAKVNNPCCSKECSRAFYKKNKNSRIVGGWAPVVITQEQFDLMSIDGTLEEFNKLIGKKFVKLKCGKCGAALSKRKSVIVRAINEGRNVIYCSCGCAKKLEFIKTNCKECNKPLEIKPYYIKKNNFCSLSCAAKYRNKNKTFGCIRSKMEFFIEEKLKQKYPNLLILPNDRNVLNGLELDFYIPSLKLAVELNGITHYEPIYGLDRLERSLESDKQKMIKCYEVGVELAVIDISHIKYFKEKHGLVIFNEVEKIIDSFVS